MPNVIVSTVERVSSPRLADDAPLAQSATALPAARIPVRFTDGTEAHLDPADPNTGFFTRTLAAASSIDFPVYATTDPDTGRITDVQLPILDKVTALRETADGLAVDLLVSHGLHTLRRDNPAFEPMRAALRTAEADGTVVLLTESEPNVDLLDVRPAPEASLFHWRHPLGPLPAAAAPAALQPLTDVSPAQAQQLFTLVAAKTCDIHAVADPCIPFLYCEDGCWLRAHEMARLIVAAGVQPGKLWIFPHGGYLCAATRNMRSCQICWSGYHVAVTLSVLENGARRTVVVDPSLFDQAVDQAQWVQAMGNAGAVLLPSDASIFWRSQTYAGDDDPGYTWQQPGLVKYRNYLEAKVRKAGGQAPPYNNC